MWADQTQQLNVHVQDHEMKAFGPNMLSNDRINTQIVIRLQLSRAIY